MDEEQNKPRSVLEYLKITPLVKEIDSKDSTTFKNELAIIVQGNAIEVDTTLDLQTYAILISVTFSTVSELILKMGNDSLIVIFSHIDEDLYIIPEATSPVILDCMNRLIYEIKSKPSYKDKYLSIKTFIDLSSIIKSLDFEKDNINIVEQTMNVLQKISESLEKTEEIEISGDAHPLILMSVLCFLRPFGKKISYLDKNDESIIIFQ